MTSTIDDAMARDKSLKIWKSKIFFLSFMEVCESNGNS